VQARREARFPVKTAKQLYAPIEGLARQQEEIGKQQEELGKKQEVLGNRMEISSLREKPRDPKVCYLENRLINN
jgi:hypothetical protein